MRNLAKWTLLLAAVLLTGCKLLPGAKHRAYSQFVGKTDLSNFQQTTNNLGELVLLSPVIKSRSPWNELVLSWNVVPQLGSSIHVEACAQVDDRTTKFYSLGNWSLDPTAKTSASSSKQEDPDGAVHADTLVLTSPADSARVRITLQGTNQMRPNIKFLGLSFCNTGVIPKNLFVKSQVWGKEVPTPEISQLAYPEGGGWCSPTSLTMALNRWAAVCGRSDWHFDVPEVAASLKDHTGTLATGNWSFNTAFAGSLEGMRACVTRFSDMSELEQWVGKGIPVVISGRSDLLEAGRNYDSEGHLTVVTGFTESGDVIINDPATRLGKQSVRRIYQRENVLRAWATSHNTVYLIFPEGQKLPHDRFRHWH